MGNAVIGGINMISQQQFVDYSRYCISHLLCSELPWLCARLSDGVQCIAFNPVIHSLLSCSLTDIGKLLCMCHFCCIFCVFFLGRSPVSWKISRLLNHELLCVLITVLCWKHHLHLKFPRIKHMNGTCAFISPEFLKSIPVHSVSEVRHLLSPLSITSKVKV